ncbi:hypothetical protein JXB28_00430 [Candidatus Woesearchaeota archaeon]|nr:hypothetical protein [Candidatus Woesearchaeota archaeon]
MSDLLGLLSGIIFLPVPFIYFRQIKQGGSTPHPITWLIALAVLTLNTFTYHDVVKGNWFKTTLPIVITVAMFFLVAYSFTKRKFGPIGKSGIITMVFALISFTYWFITRNNQQTNIVLQISLLVAWWPTLEGLLKGTLREKPLSWAISALAYSLLVASNILNYQGLLPLLYPFVNGFLGNLSVAIIAFLRNRKTQISEFSQEPV